VKARAMVKADVSDLHVPPDELMAARFAALVPRPGTLASTGLSADLLGDLASKLLLRSGVLSLSELADRLAIAGGILMDVLALLRKEARIEVRPGGSTEAELCYNLTERGRQAALHALHRDGYIGPAPVRLEDYARLVTAQAARDRRVNRNAMRQALSGVVLTDALRDRLGAALNSGRALFLYGPAGTGKTFVASRLQRAAPGGILIPHALLVSGAILRVFDPAVHELIEPADAISPLMLNAGFDRRYVCCQRPVIHVGGELESSMLDVELRASTHELLAPLQLKANNGILIIDDLGRQRSTTEQILNRWIVPMEERVDHFSIGGGAYFTIPFDVVLVFSTNLQPEALTDDALRRRLGYKIAFGPISPESYREIWEQTCAALQLPFERELVDFVIEELHRRRGVELLPVHPRDLLRMIVDRLRYEEQDILIDRDLLTWAWDSNFFQSR
jgi:predicted ATPase with chaperone activity